MDRWIELTQGFSTVVDESMFLILNQHRWHYSKGYASRWVNLYPGRSRIFMQNVILDVDRGVDHIDRNRLNNRRSNLREASDSLQMYNRVFPVRDLPRGVTLYQGRYAARISINNVDVRLGMYTTPEEAHHAYLKKCLEVYGEHPPT